MSVSDITRFVNSKSMVAVAGILMLAAARIAFQSDEVTYFAFDRGLVLRSANLWISSRWLTMVINTGLLLATALMWMLLVQFFNPFRAMTTLPASFFLIMMLSVPDLTDQLYTGTMLSAVLPVCLALLWSSFADIGRLRHIFLLFFILSGLAMTQYCFLIYIPVFIIGCVQMRLFSLRTVIACVVGLVTPWWIALGLGLVTPDDFHKPEMTGFFTTFDAGDILNVILVSTITLVLFVLAWIANLVNVIKLNVSLRAFNGSISLLAVFTVIAGLADFTNSAIYLPTLMLLTSYQLSFMFGWSNNPRRFIPILAIMGVYVALYVFRVLI